MKNILGVATRHLANIEPTENSDTITGTAADEAIDGGGGNDVIDGGAGLDTITGGLGDDVLYGGSYYDAIDGGDGNDLIIGDLYFSEPNDINDHYIQATTPDSTDWIRGGAGDDTIATGSWTHDYVASEGLGNPYGGALNFADGTSYASSADSAWGQAGNDEIHGTGTLGGGAGDDSITTASGPHTVYGGTGDDFIYSAYGSGLLYGGEGNDTIIAGFGSDTIWGGAGNDSIRGDDSGEDTNSINIYKFLSGHGDDTISALGVDHEVIDLSRLDERFDDFDDLLLATEEVTPDTSHGYGYAFLITTGDGDSILIQGRGDVSLSDIDFVL
jgi:Ca2+-binding RTX toxin-like protein